MKAAIAAAILLGGTIAARQPAGLAFDVATIKPSTPNSPPISITSSPGRFSASNTSLQMLITWAFDLEGTDRLVGAPPWLDAQRFDISATVPAPTPQEPAGGERLKSMMQTFLTDRFGMAWHRESRDLPVFALLVEGARPKVDVNDAGADRGRGSFAMLGRGRLMGTQVTLASLAKVLSEQLRRTVQDATGVDGVFDFMLEWEPDTPGAPATGGPSLFTALREQLGLRLEATRGSVPVVVIDRIERLPTPD